LSILRQKNSPYRRGRRRRRMRRRRSRGRRSNTGEQHWYTL
jgi:hypothetical protein